MEPATTRAERYLIFGVVSLAMLTSSMQFSMVSVGLPDVIDGLDAPLRWVGWIITIYTLAQAVSMPIAGKLSDELGRRTVFAGGLGLFSVASVACALAPNIYVLIAARAVQGVAGGSLMPSAYGIIGDAFAHDRARALGLISSIFPIGSVVGPNVGGLIVDNFGWRWTFGMNGPIGAAVVVAILLVMRGSDRRERTSIDYIGAALLAMAVGGIVFSLTELSRSEADPSMLIVAISLIAAVIGGALFVRREMRYHSPVVDMALLRRKEFAYMNLLNFFYGVSVFGLFSFIPLYAESAYGMSAGESGALLTPRAIAMIGTSALAAWLLPRTGYRRPLLFGLLLMATGLVVMSLGIETPSVGPVHFSNFAYLAFVVCVTGIAFGAAGPASNNAAIELAPERVAAISGLRGMFRSLGGAIGTAVIVLITSRADSTAEGLETAFLGLAGVTLFTIIFVFGIPDAVGSIESEERAGAGGATAEPATR